MKLGSLLDAYGINRIRIGFFLPQFHLWTPTQQPARNHFAYDGGDFVSSTSIFLSFKSTTPALNGLSIAAAAGAFNDAQLDDGNTSRKAPHAMLGHCRPPSHKRELQSESWRVGITAISPLVCYRPCVTYSFVPFSLPRPLNAFSPRIYSTFCSLTAPFRYSGPGFITPTQAPLP